MFFFIPSEYTLSKHEMAKGKTLVYFDSLSGEYSYRDVYYQKLNGNEYLITKSYKKDEVFDSLIELNGRLHESYSWIFANKQPVKAQILRDTVIDNHRKFGRRELDVRFINDSMKLTILSKSEFLKDTIFIWKNAPLPTLVVQSQYISIINKHPENDGVPDFTLDITTYYAKGIGEVRMRVFNITEQRFKHIDLIEIKNKSD